VTKYHNVNSRLATNKALINDLCQFKGYGSRRLLTEFQEINWNKKGLNSLLKKIQEQEAPTEHGNADRIMRVLKRMWSRWPLWMNWY